METINLNLPYPEVALILDALRHYIHHIEHLDDNTDEDTLADLLNDNERLKSMEQSIAGLFAKTIGPY